jgi:hypothetical protein
MKTNELGQFGTPKVGGNDSIFRNPVGVNVYQGLLSSLAFGGLQGSNQDSIGVEKVRDGGSFGQELWVGEDVEAEAGLGVGLEDDAHRFGRPAWDR